MELALYCPAFGFYEKENDTIGQHGDFYTSVSVGPLFGQLLAFQFAEWVEVEVGGQKSDVSLVEAGAHDGKLARDILHWLQHRRPALFARMEYRIVEPSARQRAKQEETLRAFAPRVKWAHGLRDLAKVRGVIFSNELLDALPVNRIGWDARRRVWFEWGVAVKDQRFAWVHLAETFPVSRFAFHAPPELLAVLPDGFTTEVCPAAENWWREAAALLEHGKLLTLDYGFTAEEFFAPQRANGTLRAYRQHHLGDDILANAGDQDITAHVNFTALQQAGEKLGLSTEVNLSQAQFLTAIAQRTWRDGSDFAPWTKELTRQFQTLTHPEHLGRAFRVLVQASPAPKCNS